jgi:choline dehydrogenase-like flavoprotein
MKHKMRRYKTSEVVDVVVIGTGAGGAPVLARLAQAGLSVVALEAGRWWSPTIEYSQDELAQAPLYWLDERLSAGSDPTAFGKNNSGCGVGGSTLHYGGFAPRPDPRDLLLHTEFGVGEDWPVKFTELLPYLEEAEKFLGVSGPESYPWDPGRKYPLPPLRLNGPAQLMERGCLKLGIRTAAAPLLALSRSYSQPGYDKRPACIHCGFCHQGCPNTSKSSMDVTYIPLAVSAGAEVREECFVHDFERDGQGRITSVIYQHQGSNVKQACRAVFLCAGAIETPRLLLHSGLANSSGQVGKNFMAHLATQVWGTFSEDVRPYKGFPASLISEDQIRAADADFAGGYLMQSLGIVPVTWAMQVARSRGLWGTSLVNYLRTFNHAAGIGINGECLPSASNYLALSSELDGRGFPKPIIYFSLGENERKMRNHADKLMREIWSAAGASDLWSVERTSHTIGTCRMGSNPGEAVVDPQGRSFDIPNLWISDNSTFPSSLPANPALTLIALALRSADYFLHHSDRG